MKAIFVYESLFKPKTLEDIEKELPIFTHKNIKGSEIEDIPLNTRLFIEGEPGIYRASIIKDPNSGYGIMIYKLFKLENKFIWVFHEAEYFKNDINRFKSDFINWDELTAEIKLKYSKLFNLISEK